jgi:hypothetical protein
MSIYLQQQESYIIRHPPFQVQSVAYLYEEEKEKNKGVKIKNKYI